jgi:hypothetical protein
MTISPRSDDIEAVTLLLLHSISFVDDTRAHHYLFDRVVLYSSLLYQEGKHSGVTTC